MDVTTDPTEFASWTKPGDVLAFDSLRSVSGLIQWADRAPVNHVAILETPDTAVMANETKGKESAVARHPLTELLGTSGVVGVRLLRPHELDGAALRQTLERYLRAPASFGYLDLAALALPALVRSYRPGRLPADAERRLLRFLLRAAKWVIAHHGAGTVVTCSGFAYLVLTQAGVDVQVDHPWEDGSLAPGWDPAVYQQVQDLEVEIAALNADGDPDSGLAADELADANLVTPGDFVRSPSFSRVAMLVTADVNALPDDSDARGLSW